MMFDFATASEKGPRRENEDSVGVWQRGDTDLAVAVADGLGGYIGGQKASQLAIKMFGSAVNNAAADLRQIAMQIHSAIQAEQETSQELRDMATTFSAAFITQNEITTIHCGDTRIALQRGSGIKRLTKDHTEAQRLLTAGKISKEEYWVYPRKNVLESALGIGLNPTIDSNKHELMPGDRVIMTSDGVHNRVFLREMKAISDDSKNASSFVENMMEAVRSRQPDDNFTIAAVFLSREFSSVR